MPLRAQRKDEDKLPPPMWATFYYHYYVLFFGELSLLESSKIPLQQSLENLGGEEMYTARNIQRKRLGLRARTPSSCREEAI